MFGISEFSFLFVFCLSLLLGAETDLYLTQAFWVNIEILSQMCQSSQLEAYLRIRKVCVLEIIANKVMASVIHPLNELCTVLFLRKNFYTSIHIANIACLLGGVGTCRVQG
jgi:hypothetical protein